ncbi:MAG: HD domain-containing protein [Caldilinea sp.]|nr:HD domain-containing protein [Caldilinea sp.]
MQWKPQQPAFEALLNALAGEVQPLYLVGGVVRDALLGRTAGVSDLDVIVERDALTVARRVADRLGWAFYPLDEGRDVARLVFTAGTTPLVCDVAAMRGGDLFLDLQARDFTVNAMAMRWQGRGSHELVDLAGGQADIAARLLRRVTPTGLAEDPIRLLRAVRLAVQLGFTIEDQTHLQILRISDTVRLSSPERIRDELWKMLASPTPDVAVEMMRAHGLLRPILPEVAEMEGVAQTSPHDTDVYQHTLRVVRHAVQLRDWLLGRTGAGDNEAAATWQAALAPHRFALLPQMTGTTAGERRHADWLVWHALWHDVGKPATRTAEALGDDQVRYRFFDHENVGAAMTARRLEWLKFSRNEVQLAETVVSAHMRPHHLDASFGADAISRRACYRFFRDTGGAQQDNSAGIDTVMLALADYQGIYAASPPPNWANYTRHMGELVAYATAPDGFEEVRTPLVDGRQLMARFQLPPGRHLRDLLERLREAQAAGEISTTEEGLDLAAGWLAVAPPPERP